MVTTLQTLTKPRDWQIGEKARRTASAVASLTALFPAAYTSYLHMTKLMNYDQIPAVIIAVAIESLGYMIADATITAMERGRRWLAVLGVMAFFFYLVVILLLNLILSAAEAISPQALVWAVIIAGADLALFSVPAFILSAIQSQLRAQDRRATQQADQDAANRIANQAAADSALDKANEQALKVLQMQLDADAKENDKKREFKAQQRAEKVSQPVESSQKVSTPVGKFPRDRRKLSDEQKTFLSKLTPDEIAGLCDITTKSAKSWLKAFEDEGISAPQSA